MTTEIRLTRQGVRDLTPRGVRRAYPLTRKFKAPPVATKECHWTEHVYWKRCVCWRALGAS